MRASVIVFPGSNCDRDVKVALEAITGQRVNMVWHADASVPPSDIIVLPGGFSYGDYLRCGAMAAHSNVMRDVIAKAKAGTPVLGICNGFQIACEAHLLPGALLRNASLQFVSEMVTLRVESSSTRFTNRYQPGQLLRIPVAHGDGRFTIAEDGLKALEDAGQVVFRYADASGAITTAANPNASLDNIAGIINARGNVLGMMPHPERAVDARLGSADGLALFESMLAAVAA